MPSLKLALPIGISFYTFQALTYVIDVYRGSVKVQPSFYKLLLYVSMFPQLIAGPIVRYSDVEEQIEERTVTLKNISAGVMRFSAGLLKKAIIANFCGSAHGKAHRRRFDRAFKCGCVDRYNLIHLQIYFDFSGYSDMAIGLGHMFGFSFPENFNYPYYAVSVSDFWRRWHITLSSFFRDYLYIPLGGNRKNWALNMLIVWLLTGLWHGASWNFVLWGLYYFVFLMLEKMYIGKILEKLPRAVGHIYSLIVVIIGWVFFYFDDLSKIKYFFKAAFGAANGFVTLTEKTVIVNYAVLLIVGAVCAMPLLPRIKNFACSLSKTRSGKVTVDVLSVLFVIFFACNFNGVACREQL